MKIEANLRLIAHQLDLPVIGHGLNSVVYDNGNTVIKISKGDRSYQLWAQFAKLNPNNPYLPKIHKITLLDKATETYQYEIEKLMPMVQRQLDWLRNHIASEYGLTVLGNHKYMGWFSEEDWKKLAHEATTKDPDLSRIATWFLDHYTKLDLHQDNIMLRGKQVVFADPVLGN